MVKEVEFCSLDKPESITLGSFKEAVETLKKNFDNDWLLLIPTMPENGKITGSVEFTIPEMKGYIILEHHEKEVAYFFKKTPEVIDFFNIKPDALIILLEPDGNTQIISGSPDKSLIEGIVKILSRLD